MKRHQFFRYASALLCIIFSLTGMAQKSGENSITILDFKVAKSQNGVHINWSTNGKVDINYFEVEKSDDGKNFKTVAYILGSDPSQTDCDCYGCLDKVNNNKEWYYRLKHVDANGKVEFSEVRTLTINS